MAFQSPPTFVDGAVLSASQLNILTANQNYLSGIASSVNPGFREVVLGTGAEWIYYSLIHAHNWLYIRVHVADNHAVLRVYASDDNFTAAIALIETAEAGGEEIEIAVDISGEGLTAGAWLRYGLRGTDGAVTVRYFAEDDGDRTA